VGGTERRVMSDCLLLIWISATEGDTARGPTSSDLVNDVLVVGDMAWSPAPATLTR